MGKESARPIEERRKELMSTWKKKKKERPKRAKEIHEGKGKEEDTLSEYSQSVPGILCSRDWDGLDVTVTSHLQSLVSSLDLSDKF